MRVDDGSVARDGVVAVARLTLVDDEAEGGGLHVALDLGDPLGEEGCGTDDQGCSGRDKAGRRRNKRSRGGREKGRGVG